MRAQGDWTRAARPKCDARVGDTADASNSGQRHPARHGQNDLEMALTRKNALFASHDLGDAVAGCAVTPVAGPQSWDIKSGTIRSGRPRLWSGAATPRSVEVLAAHAPRIRR
jgi:hypothetical protein